MSVVDIKLLSRFQIIVVEPRHLPEPEIIGATIAPVGSLWYMRLLLAIDRLTRTPGRLFYKTGNIYDSHRVFQMGNKLYMTQDVFDKLGAALQKEAQRIVERFSASGAGWGN